MFHNIVLVCMIHNDQRRLCRNDNTLARVFLDDVLSDDAYVLSDDAYVLSDDAYVLSDDAHVLSDVL